jgi:hypothetical protein
MLILKQKKEGAKRKQRIKVKQKSKQTPQQVPVGNQLAVEASARAWRFPERTAVAVDLRQHRRQQLLHENGRERPLWQSTG